MNRLRFEVSVEDRMQLVIEGTDTARHEDVLRDAGEISRVLAWAVEDLSEVRGETIPCWEVSVAPVQCHSGAEHRDESALGDPVPHFLGVIASVGRGARPSVDQLVPQDSLEELLKLATWFDPELVAQD